jgi:hypothetical protein
VVGSLAEGFGADGVDEVTDLAVSTALEDVEVMFGRKDGTRVGGELRRRE